MPDETVTEPVVQTPPAPAPTPDLGPVPPLAPVPPPAPPLAAIDYSQLNVPEMLKDEAIVAKIREQAEQHKAPLELAQTIVDSFAAEMEVATKAAKDAQTAQREAWKAELTADKDFGGHKLAESTAKAAAALDTYGDAELRKWLNETAVGEHPALFRFLARVGRDASEAPIVPSNAQSPVGDLRTIYPSMYSDRAA
jgi:hypothetical protein